MSRSRPASNPISYHKHTKQYYITRGGKRVYLGSDRDQALKRYHEFGLGTEPVGEESSPPVDVRVKDLANRFLAAQQANWRNPASTLKCYKDWLGRFIKDHPRLRAVDFTVERFAAWKLSLKASNYSPESINHYLGAVRAMFTFAEETGIIPQAPKLKRVKNEVRVRAGSKEKPLYQLDDLSKLLKKADSQMKAMIMLALNCGFGPKDIRDLTWDDFDGDRVTLPRSKTGVCQTYLLWSETHALLDRIRYGRAELIARMAKLRTQHSDNGHVFYDQVLEALEQRCDCRTVP
jgi:integrase